MLNSGVQTPCLGIVFTVTEGFYYCRTITSVDSTIDDSESIALFLQNTEDCVVSSTSIALISSETITGTQPRTWPTCGTKSHIWSHNNTWTHRWPTSYSRPAYTTSGNFSTTVEANMSSTTMDTSISTPYSYYSMTSCTTPLYNTTKFDNYTTPYTSTYTPSSGTGGPITTSNSSSCGWGSIVTDSVSITQNSITTITETLTGSASDITETTRRPRQRSCLPQSTQCM
jgi:hypothetical protein